MYLLAIVSSSHSYTSFIFAVELTPFNQLLPTSFKQLVSTNSLGEITNIRGCNESVYITSTDKYTDI